MATDPFVPFGATGAVSVDLLHDSAAADGIYLGSSDVTSAVVAVSDAPSGVVLAGCSALAMTYVASSSGKWRARIPATAPVAIGQHVHVVATLTLADGRVARFADVVPVEEYAGE